MAWMQPSFPFAPGAVDSDPGAELSEKGAGFRWRRRWLERPLGDEARRRIRQVFGARGAAMEGVSEADVASMKVVELRKELKKRGKDTKGCVRDGSRQEWEDQKDRNDKRTDDTDECDDGRLKAALQKRLIDAIEEDKLEKEESQREQQQQQDVGERTAAEQTNEQLEKRKRDAKDSADAQKKKKKLTQNDEDGRDRDFDAKSAMEVDEPGAPIQRNQQEVPSLIKQPARTNRDPLEEVASLHWDPSTVSTPTWNAELVEAIYENEIRGSSVAGEKFRKGMRTLEFTRYLEEYLWKTLEDGMKSEAHLLSIVHLINQKFYEGLEVWPSLRDRPELFPVFFQNVVRIMQSAPESPSASEVRERCCFLLFLSNALASLEEPMVRKEVLRIFGLPLWYHLPVGRRELEFASYPALAGAWASIEKREAKRARNNKGDVGSHLHKLEQKTVAAVLPNLLNLYWRMLLTASMPVHDRMASDLKGAADAFCQYFASLMVDLLSQLPTRRIVLVWADAHAVLVGSRHSKLYKESPTNHGFRRLVDRATMYAGFGIDGGTGEPLRPDDMQAAEDNKAFKLQQLFFHFWKDQEGALDLALAPVSKIQRGQALHNFVMGLSAPQLEELVCTQLCLLSPDFATAILPASHFTDKKELLAAAVVEKFSTDFAPLPASAIAEKMSLYPDEFDVGDPRLTDTIDRRLLEAHKIDSAAEMQLLLPSAFPKLSLQYLTMEDYLLRHLELYRLEAAAAVRDDLMECLLRLQPKVKEDGQVQLLGWARMALPLEGMQMGVVDPPRVGCSVPAKVYASLQLGLSSARSQQAKYEWSKLRQGDIVYLVELHVQDNLLEHEDNWPSSGVMRRFGLKRLRGAKLLGDAEIAGVNTLKLQISLDPSQYSRDVSQDTDAASFHLVMRRKGKENNYPAVLSCLQQMLAGDDVGERDVPFWLRDVLLGYGNPEAATSPMGTSESSDVMSLDFGDTFQDEDHLRECFAADAKFDVSASLPATWDKGSGFFCRLSYKGNKTNPYHAELFGHHKDLTSFAGTGKNGSRGIRFTKAQIMAIACGVRPGLTIIQGPPGTGKTDVAVQIARLLHRNFPQERTLVITHSNHALNDIFAKIAGKGDGSDGGIAQRYLLRLGRGESELKMRDEDDEGEDDPRMRSVQTFDEMLDFRMESLQDMVVAERNMASAAEISSTPDPGHLQSQSSVDTFLDPDSSFGYDFTRQGRIDQLLHRRQVLLERVSILATSMGLNQDEASTASYSCENARHFWTVEVLPTWELFLKEKDKVGGNQQGSTPAPVVFPFKEFFARIRNSLQGGSELSRADGFLSLLDRSEEEQFEYISSIFRDLEECRPFELLTHASERGNFLLTKHAKLIAMTCTHAAMRRSDFLRLSLFFDSIIVEESAQITEVESFIPLALQKGGTRLKRAVLIGDHKQLPPVIRCAALRRESHMDQSLFARLVRLGVPSILLDRQGRSRPRIADLYRWQYPGLGDLRHVIDEPLYNHATGGFAHVFQVVDVPDSHEHSPAPHAFQNLGEAEYLASVFQYARLCRHRRDCISVLTTYASQKQLLRDVFARRCGQNPLFGMPANISTVDEFQGQQNDIVLLSLVRTASIGHIRDARRLVVALSRARLSLYVFCNYELFSGCQEMSPLFHQSKHLPLQLELVLGEDATTERGIDELEVDSRYLVENASDMHSLVDKMAIEQWQKVQSAEANNNKKPLSAHETSD